MIPKLTGRDSHADLPIKDRLYEALKLSIISCEIPPGGEVSEGMLASLYDVGKASVRDALSRLGQEGWVVSRPRRGHIIAPMTLADVEDVFEMRRLVEPESAARAAGHMTLETLEALNAHCARNYPIGDPQAKRMFLLANRDFHVAIAAASGSSRLSQLVQKLHEEALRILYVSASDKDSSETWSRGHGPMIEAIASGDREAAYRTTLAGIDRSQEHVMKVLTQAPDLLAGPRRPRALLWT